jgi:catechol 2,3-dioxygenase-like lactoylglutathione lyase family enzyme
VIDHLSFGVSDLDRSRAFYDQVLATLGYRRLANDDSSLGYGAEEPVLWLLKTARPPRFDAESGVHVSFKAPTRAGVDEFHGAAMKNGGQDNGPPGPRPAYGPSYYAAFVIDPDGYRLEAHCEVTEPTA